MKPLHRFRRAASLPEGALPRTNAFRVLVVDDLAQNRSILSQILSRVGYEAETAGNGAEALSRVVCQPRPDLILTDVEMPVMDGITLARALRQLPADIARIPLVAASGSLDPVLKREMLLAGADAFVSKPVHVPELLEVVGRLIREAAGRQPGPPADAEAAGAACR